MAVYINLQSRGHGVTQMDSKPPSYTGNWWVIAGVRHVSFFLILSAHVVSLEKAVVEFELHSGDFATENIHLIVHIHLIQYLDL